MQNGFPAKRIYSGQKGLYIEFYQEIDAENFYLKGMIKGSRIEKQDAQTIIVKFSEALATPR